MSYSFQNLTTPKNVASGIAELVLLAPKGWITTLAAPTAPFTNAGDEITITGDHVFIATKGFAKHQLAPQKNSLEIKTRGDIGMNGQHQEAKLFLPGSYAEVHEQMKNLLNTPLVALVKDSSCGADMYYQLGCDCTSAWMTCDFTTGTTKDGVKGYMATIIYDDGPLIYKGAITYLP
jgi:hypothetical protein